MAQRRDRTETEAWNAVIRSIWFESGLNSQADTIRFTNEYIRAVPAMRRQLLQRNQVPMSFINKVRRLTSYRISANPPLFQRVLQRRIDRNPQRYAQPIAQRNRRNPNRIRRINVRHGLHYTHLNNFDEYVKYYIYNVKHKKNDTLFEFLTKMYSEGKYYSLYTKKWRKY